jgi:hypothetical protein
MCIARKTAAPIVEDLIHGDCLDVNCPIESFGLMFPTCVLLGRVCWLKAGGVLVLVVPMHICECGEILASQF